MEGKLPDGQSVRPTQQPGLGHRSLFNDARREGLIATNPAEGVKTFKKEKEARDVFTHEQLAVIIRAAGPEWRTAILLAYYGGRLTDLGLVEKRADGNRRLYTANWHHPLFPDIRNLVLKTSGLADTLRAALGEEPAIVLAFVFGSVASGEQQAQSDIDLMVIGSVGLRALTRLLSGIAGKLGRKVNPHVFTVEEFLRRKKARDHFLSPSSTLCPIKT